MIEDVRDPIAAAIEAHARYLAGEFGADVDAFLSAHEELRELLEPLVEPDEAPPERVGDFELLRVVGRGGMGVVYEARQCSLNKRVALKLLAPHTVGSPRALARFRREAVLAAGLEHPNVARVVAFDEADGVCHLAMEFVDGVPLDLAFESLASEAAHHPTTRTGSADSRASAGAVRDRTVRSAVELTRQVARALEHAHDRGVVHRDVKPGNILVTPDARAVLTDFGLAREIGRDGLTVSGEFAGTWQYAAPEQIDGRTVDIDGRADLFSLGVVLYELLAGRRPFDGVSYDAVRDAVLREEPPPLRRLAPRVGRDLAAVVARCIEKRPNDRYRTAGELANDLDRVLRGEPVAARPVSAVGRARRWIQRQPRTAATLAAFAIGALLLIATLWRARDAARREVDTNQRLQTLRVGRNLAELQVRERLAVPAWPASTRELAALVTAVEEFGAEGELLDARIRGLRTSGKGIATAPRGTHPLSARVAQLEHQRRRMQLDLDDPGLPAAARDAFAAELARRETRLAGLRERISASEAARFDSAEDRFVHDELETQLAALEELHDIVLPDLRRRLDWSEHVQMATIGRFAAEWAACAERVRVDPRYGFTLHPQIGLVPIGPDPDSGLEEFAHLRSFADPDAFVATRPLTTGADCGIIFVLVPAGAIGSSEGGEVPIRPFLLGKHELSRAQWSRMCGDLPGLSLYDGGIIDLRNLTETEKPANGVTWMMAYELLRRHGLRLPSGDEWLWSAGAAGRLPTEMADWLGRENVRDLSYSQARGLPVEQVAPFDDGVRGLAAIDSMEAGPFGFHHLLGNVQEWCADAYPAGDAVDPRTGSVFAWSATVLRTIRGSAWNDTPQWPYDFAIPDRAVQGTSARNVGLRAARSLIDD